MTAPRPSAGPVLGRRALLALLAMLACGVRARAQDGAPAGDGPEARRLHALLDADLEARMREWPLWAVLIGWPLPDPAALPELTPQAQQRRLRHAREMLAAAGAIPEPALGASDRVSLRLFADLQRADIARAERFPHADALDFNQKDGVHLWLDDVAARLPVRGVADVDTHLRRLERLPQAVDEQIALLRRGAAAGWVSSRVVLSRVPAQIRDQIAPGDDVDALALPLRRLPPQVPAAERDALRRRFAVAREAVDRAFDRLARVTEQELLPAAAERGGLSALPGGVDYYVHLMHTDIAPGLEPGAVHDLGRREMARIGAAIDRLAREEGHAGGTPDWVRRRVDAADQRYAGPDELLAAYRALGAEVQPRLPALFRRLPAVGFEIVEASPAQAASGTMAWYDAPPIDGSRPGRFVLNTTTWRERRRHEEVSLFLHEAMPGHHLQQATALEQPALPRWRRLVADNGAYAEGWALYAERLGEEMGLYTTPLRRFGRLQDEIWRAARLVVDTGIHVYGWSRERAIALLRDEVFTGEADAASEIDRYFAWPTQALGYKLGELEIIALREQAARVLGPRFDVRDFHAAVLGAGGVTLPVLRAEVGAWVAAGGGDPAAGAR
ncbi:MAG: DUF885 domain-containing protein [Rubrivivax sp.]|nr:DUF885 domain-containing protein [Rubrivivax sp.]